MVSQLCSGLNKTSLGLVTTILDVNLNNTNPLTVKAKKILPSVARTVSFFQNHEDFFAEYYSQLSKRLIKANGASQQELTVMKEKKERMVTHLEEALAHFDSQELRN